MNTFSGNYPIEPRAGEIERLRVQAKVMEPDAVTMLERFGSMAGWVCLDKPEGLGSTQAVGRVRRAFNAQKADQNGRITPVEMSRPLT